MKRACVIIIPMMLAMALAGCGQSWSVKIGASDKAISVVPMPNLSFFQNATFPKEVVTLHPDALVEQQIPNFPTPKTTVDVYLPVYPGSTRTNPVSGIGDMGTSMDADLVDGTLYFKSNASQAEIEKWYEQQLKRYGYVNAGSGRTEKWGNTTSEFVDFTKDGFPGNPTKSPDINLGFLAHRDHEETIFKVKASFIITPTRPENSFLPNDVVKVALTEGKITKTITNQKWIASVVEMVNALQVSTPGVSSGGTIAYGGPTAIYAKFYRKSGSIINLTYSMLPETIEVGQSGVSLNIGPSPTLVHDLDSVFNR